VASDGEIKELSAIGVKGEQMLYANPFKTAAGLAACRAASVTRFTFDSASELKKIARSSPGAAVLLRIRVDNPDAVVDLNKKFGASPAETVSLLRQAAEQGLKPVGLCFHVGSQTYSTAPYLKSLATCRQLFDEARSAGYDLTILDIGGGYPAPSLTKTVDVQTMFSEINAKLDELFPDTEIYSEPGRFICATAVNMITKVIGMTERNGQPWYILDEGVYGTFSGIMFDHWDYELINFKTGQPLPATFAGPSCDSLDIISANRLTAPLAMDDLILVPVCGAYSSASATTFNGFARTSTVVWEDVGGKTFLEKSFSPKPPFQKTLAG
ncbi:MAG: type III PLP-dependent enzyme, partial [Sporomusaceae bacterium]|nr:type III PLP-dependent enzyme [Sporomusaceae bacterium]